MKLSDSIEFKNDLVKIINRLSISAEINHRISTVESLINDKSAMFNEKINNIIFRYKQIDSESQNIVNSVLELISDIDNQIYDMSTDLIQHQNEAMNHLPYHLLLFHYGKEYRKIISETVKSVVTNRSYWNFPGLQICPLSKEWIDIMVANDPLYLVDANLSVLTTNISEYPDVYQRRLRLYDSLEKLPTNQFGIIFIWDFFNYLLYDLSVEYLKKCFLHLRPGGTLIFSYNNCDIYTMAKIAEENQMYYSSKSRLTKICEELGYEIVRTDDEPLPDSVLISSWFELRKPGTLTTVKKSQAMGAVLSK
jgi:hypothetical protein